MLPALPSPTGMGLSQNPLPKHPRTSPLLVSPPALVPKPTSQSGSGQRNPTSSFPLQINPPETLYWFSTGAGWIQPCTNPEPGLHVGHLTFSRTMVLGRFKLV